MPAADAPLACGVALLLVCGVPQCGQKANAASHGRPHAAHTRGSCCPQRGQNAKSREASEPQPVQVTVTP